MDVLRSFRADHVIIQSYEEQIDEQRLHVALFIKDPYRHNVALTNEQILTVLRQYRNELDQDLKYQVKTLSFETYSNTVS
jgi:hypothetical protein